VRLANAPSFTVAGLGSATLLRSNRLDYVRKVRGESRKEEEEEERSV
jgi:hypothetical protein